MEVAAARMLAGNATALPTTLFDSIITNVCADASHVHCATDSLLLAPVTALFVLAAPFLIADTLGDTPATRRKGYVGSRAASDFLPSSIRAIVAFILALSPLIVVGACACLSRTSAQMLNANRIPPRTLPNCAFHLGSSPPQCCKMRMF